MSISRRDVIGQGLLGVVPATELTAASTGQPNKKPTGLEDQIAELAREVAALREAVNYQSRVSPPIGSVTAFAGEWLPLKPDGKTRWMEAELGWLLCDGRSFKDVAEHLKKEFAALKVDVDVGALLEPLSRALPKAQETRTIPDFRGYFLRGVDVALDGKTTSERDKGGIRPAGKAQGHSTAKPALFAIKDAPEFDPAEVVEGKRFDRVLMIDGKDTVDQRDHMAPKDKFEANLCDSRPLKKIPAHKHETEGWDGETRPVNVAVFWIIKFK